MRPPALLSTSVGRRFSAAAQQALIASVRAYRLLLKPWLGNACRFEPTCSAYALLALQRHGAWHGLRLSGWRVLRCHPLCAGGCDPVPETLSRRHAAAPPAAPAASGVDPPVAPLAIRNLP
jgi:putative membrane protein insertion efficiency factor